MAGVYIHVPFCKQACNYCNFYFSVSMGNKDRYLDALLREIELTRDYLAEKKLNTIYFGGGTPSRLEAEELKRITAKLSEMYDLSDLQEFTLEANPDDLTTEKLRALKELQGLGLNRFSIGVQSFAEADLVYMNRAHRAQEAIDSIKRVQDAGFEKITLDLIYGTPTMPDEVWQQNLQTALELGVQHISAYALTVEPKTALQNKIRKGARLPVDEQQSARQFDMLVRTLEGNGFDQYEISNFARTGHYAVHNSNYWKGHAYLGLGPSAHSFDGRSRRWNVSNNLTYIKSIEGDALNFEEETLSPVQALNEKIMTGLRTIWGFDTEMLPANRSAEFFQNLRSVDVHHYELIGKVMRLTRQGKLFADGIAARLFIAED